MTTWHDRTSGSGEGQTVMLSGSEKLLSWTAAAIDRWIWLELAVSTANRAIVDACAYSCRSSLCSTDGLTMQLV